jgi:hypothetical protein
MAPVVLFVLGAAIAAEALAVAAAPSLVRRVVNAMSDAEMRFLAVIEGFVAAAAIYAGFTAM